MTVDELLAKLGAEYDRITGELPKVYEELGKVAYPKIRDTVAGVYVTDMSYEMNQITNKLARKRQINDIMDTIRREVEKAST